MQSYIERVQRFPVVVSAPTPGAEFSIAIGGSNLSVPGLGAYRILSLTFQFVSSATVATRSFALVMDDQTTTYLQVGAPGSQAASLTEQYAAFEGSTGGGANGPVNHFAWPTPAAVLYPGHRLRSVTTNIQIGDQYSNIAMLVEELPSGRYFQTQPIDRVMAEPWEPGMGAMTP